MEIYDIVIDIMGLVIAVKATMIIGGIVVLGAAIFLIWQIIARIRM